MDKMPQTPLELEMFIRKVVKSILTNDGTINCPAAAPSVAARIPLPKKLESEDVFDHSLFD